jgi:hypothetical protein
MISDKANVVCKQLGFPLGASQVSILLISFARKVSGILFLIKKYIPPFTLVGFDLTAYV